MKKRKICVAFLSLILALAISNLGCAMVMHGSDRFITVKSEPADSRVRVNGIMGKDSEPIRVPSQGYYSIMVEKEGYQPEYLSVSSRYHTGSLVLDILQVPIVLGFIWIMVDAFSGAWFKLDPDAYEVYLKSAGVNDQLKTP
jgi:hypothetical protein